MIEKILSYYKEKLFFWCLENQDSPLVEELDHVVCENMLLEYYMFRFAKLITIQKTLYY
jgi:hypothetical protein